jgi:hypothetical protein
LTLTAERSDGQNSEVGLLRLVSTQTVGPLPAALAAVAAPTDVLEVVAADGAGDLGLAIVTRIVTDGDPAHALTACRSAAALASARTSLPSM